MSSFIEFTTIALVLVYIGVAAWKICLPHHLGQHWRVLRIPDRRVLHSPGGLLGGHRGVLGGRHCNRSGTDRCLLRLKGA
jgi:hypothetical protein